MQYSNAIRKLKWLLIVINTKEIESMENGAPTNLKSVFMLFKIMPVLFGVHISLHSSLCVGSSIVAMLYAHITRAVSA